MSTYPAGTVAIATVRGVEGVRVFRTVSSDDDSSGLWRHGWVNGSWCSRDAHVTDIRPLVVLDLDEMALRGGWGSASNLIDSLAAKGYRSLAIELREQTKQPRIPEPGLWAVVEATIDSERVTLVHHETAGSGAAAWHETGGSWWHWSSLINPTLVREGVES